MFYSFYHEIISVLPEVFFSLAICFFLFYFSILSAYNFSVFKKTLVLKNVAFWISLQILFFVLVLLMNNSLYMIIPSSSFSNDGVSFFGRTFLFILSIFILAACFSAFKDVTFFNFEFYFVFLISVFSIIIIMSASDLMFFYLCFELQTLSFYILAVFNKNSAFSTESGLKYFVISAISSGFYLFGSSIIYGFLGSTNYFVIRDLLFSFPSPSTNTFIFYIGFIFIVFSFLFKLGVAPFHIWIPDVYEGASSKVTFFFICVSKLAFFIAFLRFLFFPFYSLFLVECQSAFLFLSFLCFVFGFSGALYQMKLKRFLIFSSIGHIGFIMLSLSSGSVIGLQGILFYIVVYQFILVAFWSAHLGVFNSAKKPPLYFDEIESYWNENKALSIFICVLVFSMAGVPPFGGFFSKFLVFLAAVGSHSLLFSIFVVCVSIISSFYYLRMLKAIFYMSSFRKNPFKSHFYFSQFSNCQAFLISSICFFFFLFSFYFNGLFILTHSVALFFIV